MIKLKDLKATGVATDEVLGAVALRFFRHEPGGAEGAALDKFVWEHSKGKYESLAALRSALLPQDKLAPDEDRRQELAEWCCSLTHAAMYRIVTSAWSISSIKPTDLGECLLPTRGWGERWARAQAAGLSPTVKNLGSSVYEDLDKGGEGAQDKAAQEVEALENRYGHPKALAKLAKEEALAAVQLRSGPTLVDSPYMAIFLWKHAPEIVGDLRLYCGFPRPFVIKRKGGVFPVNLDADDDWLPDL